MAKAFDPTAIKELAKGELFEFGTDKAIKVTPIEYKGEKYIDIRQQYMSETKGYQPTTKGLWIKMKDLNNGVLAEDILNCALNFVEQFGK
jgi:hypothetical protein